MLPRTLEPEVMDTAEDAAEYADISNGSVNDAFASEALALAPTAGRLLDLGTGPGDIAIRIAERSALDVVAVDLADHMLAIARRAAEASPAAARLTWVRADVKDSGFAAGSFDAVVSNSVSHHIPDPTELFAEIVRVARPGASIFVKDLLRPASAEDLEALVARYAADDTPYQRTLFQQSLHAALTLDEVRACCRTAGLEGVTIEQVSDRHWVVARPAWTPSRP